jgi:hypothetical protein
MIARQECCANNCALAFESVALGLRPRVRSPPQVRVRNGDEGSHRRKTGGRHRHRDRRRGF